MRVDRSPPPIWIMVAGTALIAVSVVAMWLTWPTSSQVSAEEADATPTPEFVWPVPAGECWSNQVRNESGDCVPNATLQAAMDEASQKCPSDSAVVPNSNSAFCILDDGAGGEEWVDAAIYDGPSRFDLSEAASAQRAGPRFIAYSDPEGRRHSIEVPDGVEMKIIAHVAECWADSPCYGMIIELSKGDEYITIDLVGTVFTNLGRGSSYDPEAGTFNFVPTIGGTAAEDDE